MASQPDPPPESLALGQFAGLRNTIAPERMDPADLVAAENIDLDDVGQASRRRGYAKKDASDHHSLVTIDLRTFVVRAGELGRLYPDYTFSPLQSVGPDPLCYTNIGETIYFSSAIASGKIVANVVQPWGAEVSEGRWVSPVMRPTETMGAISGRLLGAPPLATEIEYFNGRIYAAHEKVLWATELYLYDLVDKTKNFIQFEHDITMLKAHADGLYVGTTQQLFFLKGSLAKGMQRLPVLDAPVIKGSVVMVPTSRVHPRARKGEPIPESNSPVFLTGSGVCVGLEGGEVYNLSQDRVWFPGAVSAAALYREDQGASSYIVAADSAGGPSGNMRFGDYVDAEIVRASQGG